MFRDKQHMSDNRALGMYNHAGTVQHFFSNDSIAVIQQLHFNLGILQELHRNLPLLHSVGTQGIALQGIQKYLGDIVAVSNNLNNIVTVNSELSFIQEIAPHIKQFSEKLKHIEKKVQHFEDNQNESLSFFKTQIKEVKDLYVQYEHGLKCVLSEHYINIDNATKEYKQELSAMVEEVFQWKDVLKFAGSQLKQYVADHEKLKASMAHFTVTDAVTLYLFTKDEKDYRKALKAIRESEKYGNSEEINRARLDYKKEENVFSIMAKNQKILESKE